MEEKKRKKAKKKKNRSGQSEDVPEAAAPSPSSETPEITLLDGEDAFPAGEAAAEEGDEPSSLLQESSSSPADPALLPMDLQQIVQELRRTMDFEAQNSALSDLLEDIKTSHATSQANLSYLIEQLRGEVLHLNQAASSQKNKEVDLDGDIQRIREEVSHLKVMQEAERERKAAEYVEIQHLREEMLKLSEGSIKQLQMVEEMSGIVQQLFKHGQSPAPMGSSELAHSSAVCTPSASEAGVELSSEVTKEEPQFPQLVRGGTTGSELDGALVFPHFTEVPLATMVDEVVVDKSEKVNGHYEPINFSVQRENHVIQHSAETKSAEIEKIAFCASSGDPLVAGRFTGARSREVSALDSTYGKAQMIQTKPVHDYSLFVDNTDFVNSNQIRHEENNLHHEFIPETIHSGLRQHTHMQVNDLKPLSDAPITGAPIRLFRFVARYVSGADLAK